jgi:hypothetical protein
VAAGNVDLIFSTIGYVSKTVTVSGKDAVLVILVKETVTQDEVVVVGYASVKRKDLTASVSSIGAKELKDNPANSAAEALAGKLAGVQVTVSEGTPGADVAIFVRGRNSITQSGAPLYVVDGIQVENALSVLSPQDIENVTVLKDAASVDGLVLWRDLKNVSPQLLPIEKPKLKLTTKSLIANVCRNYRPIAKKCPLFQCPAAIAPSRMLGDVRFIYMSLSRNVFFEKIWTEIHAIRPFNSSTIVNGN